VLAAADPLTVKVVVAFARFERQTERVDVEFAALRWVRGDHAEAGDELDLHDGLLLPCRGVCEGRAGGAVLPGHARLD
jgi:hypothetical protein